MKALLILGLLVGVSAAAHAAEPTAAQRTRGYLDAIRQIDPQIRSVLWINPRALDEAGAADRRTAASLSPPLNGLPLLVKDNIDIAGLPNTAGSLALKDNVPTKDAPMITRLRAAGVVILGKTNLSEWANIRSSESLSGWSGLGGQTRNPHDPARSPCGSSAGSGAAVAAGLAQAAIGTETDGSITCPASINGLVGLKPTVGLVSRTGIIPISASQDTAGPMTTTVTDAARLLTAMAGTDPSDPATAQADSRRSDYVAALRSDSLKGVRIGVMRYATGFHAPTDLAFEKALIVLRDRGAVLVDIKDFPNRSAIGGYEIVVLLTELKVGLNAYLAGTDPARVETRTLADVIAFNRLHADDEMPLFGQDLFEQAEATGGLADPVYVNALAQGRRLAAGGLDSLLKDNQLIALVGPTVGPSWLIDPVLGDRYVGGGAGNAAAVAGYPHLTVPMGRVSGLPVGLSFVGPAWSEARLLGLGFAYEQASRP
jgi:amidase